MANTRNIGDLFTVNPNLAREWHSKKNGSLNPAMVSANSHQKVWWICSEGHEWQAQIKSRNIGIGCPYCSGRNVTLGNSLLDKNPNLAKEWHPTKNKEFEPSQVSCGSKKVVWWQCSEGHEWQAQVYYRNKGQKCPICFPINHKPRRVKTDYNLEIVNPKLSSEWHPSRNGNLFPRDVTPGSDKKVWWTCIYGHEWVATIGSRNKGAGCPYCAGQKVTAENSLQTVNPLLSKEWHPTKNNITPADVAANSKKKIFWLCSQGHEWQALVSNRNVLRQGCPYCSGQRPDANNNLQVVYPMLASQWHPSKNGNLLPKDITPSTKKKIWWICSNGHEWQASVSNRNKGQGCPYCAGKKPSETHNFAIINPLLIKEWHPTKNGILTPYDVTPNSKKKVWWVCSRGHEWQATMDKRTAGRRCPFCHAQTSQLELRAYTEIKHLFEDTKHRYRINGLEIDVFIPMFKIGIEIDGLFYHKDKYQADYDKMMRLKKEGIILFRLREQGLKKISETDIFFKQNKTEVKSIRELVKLILINKIFPNVIKSRLEKYVQEAEIVNEQEYIKLLHMLPSPVPGNSLAHLNKTLADEWHHDKNGTLMPLDVTPNSNKIVWWKCKRGHEWRANVISRNKGNGCPYCSGKKATPDTCLNYINPTLSGQWHPTKNGILTPYNVTPMSGKKVWWQCTKGHEWRTRIANRSLGAGCPYCSSNLVCEDNCLQTINPELSEQWHPTKNGNTTTKDVTPNSGKKAWWLCEKGHSWKAIIQSRNRGNNCPFCGGRKVTREQSLGALNPLLTKEWNSQKNGRVTPWEVSTQSNKKVWWLCKMGHEWQALIYQRTTYKTGCPYCSRKKASSEYCLETKNPLLAQQWHPTKNESLKPSDVTPNSGRKAWWICSNGHEWYAVIGSRNKGNGCPYCANSHRKSRATIENCLLTVNPRLSQEWHPTRNQPLTPENVSANSHKKAWWRCEMGHEWEAQIKSRNKGGHGCPYCNRLKRNKQRLK